MEKNLDQQKRLELNAIKSNKQNFSMLIQQFAGSAAGLDASTLALVNGGITGLNQETIDRLNMDSDTLQKIGNYKQSMATMNANFENFVSMSESAIEEKYDNYKEMMLEPLKAEEEELQTEKDTLESQVQVAKEDYEACKKMEQDGAKTFAPQYTA